MSLDLDALVPKKEEVKIGGETLYIKPPKLSTLVLVTSLGRQLDEGTLTKDTADKLEAQLIEELNFLIPGLDKHQLNVSQILSLVSVIAEMATPKELENAKKKTAKGK